MNYKAILFDLDGTITDSGPGIMRSVQYALEKIGHPEEDLQKLREFVGPPLKEQFMSYAGVDEDTALKAVSFYREWYVPKGIFDNSVYPGVEELLRALKKDGFLLGIASSKPEVFVLRVLDHFSLTKYFDVVAGALLDEKRTRKAEVIEYALEKLGMSADRSGVLMVGDREHDVLGARSAGLDCAAVTYGYGSREELVSAAPVFLLDHPYELYEMIKKNRNQNGAFSEES